MDKRCPLLCVQACINDVVSLPHVSVNGDVTATVNMTATVNVSMDMSMTFSRTDALHMLYGTIVSGS